MTDKKYKYWLAVVDDQLVQFADLPHMMAKALHPAGEMAYAAARINLEDELKLAVQDGLLKVRNPAGLGLHTFPHGDSLQRAVLIPDTDLKPFLNARGIELRITPYGNGPVYWTLENAALALQEQEGWHNGTRAKFLDQLQEAANKGELVVLDPQTCLPTLPEVVHTFWEHLTHSNMNDWLEKLGAPYRWNFSDHAEYAEAWKNLEALEALEKERLVWESTTAVTVSELERKKEKIAALTASINALNADVNSTPLLAENLAIEQTLWHLLATPAELIAVFGTFTGMEKAWFNNVKDTPKLKDAKYSHGKGGRNGREPLYFVFLVMQWLINKKRRKGKPMTEATGWRLLRTQFPKVYAEHQSYEPD